MSDNNVSDGAAAAPAWQERKNLLLAGLLGIVVLAVAAYFLLFAGSSEESYPPVQSAKTSAGSGAGAGGAAAPSASASASPKVVPAVFDEDVYGDPFNRLYPPKASAAATVTAPVATTAPIVDVPVDQSGAAPVDESSASETVSVKLIRVVDDNTVVVRVGGSKDNSTYNSDTEFGGYFTLVSTRPDENEATFTFGDGSPFTLSEGQTKKFVV